MKFVAMQTLREELVDAVVGHFSARQNHAQEAEALSVDVGETVDSLAFVAAQFIAALPPDARPALTLRFIRAFQDALVAEVIAAIQREAERAARN
ncbi:hypothetical protein [Alsobacter sp. R-9]